MGSLIDPLPPFLLKCYDSDLCSDDSCGLKANEKLWNLFSMICDYFCVQ